MPKSSSADSAATPAGGRGDAGLDWFELGPDDLDEIFSLHLAGMAGLPDPGIVKPERREFFAMLLGGGGRILGVRHGPALIAYGVLQHDLSAEGVPRRTLGVGAAEPVAKLAGAAVARGYRGRGLQRLLARRRVDLAAANGYRQLFSTSSPQNPVSWANLLAEGFVIVDLAEKYGGLLRLILHRGPDREAVAPSVWCPADDGDAVRHHLASGLIGVAQRIAPDGRAEIGFGAAAQREAVE